jgi:hypothetical protein
VLASPFRRHRAPATGLELTPAPREATPDLLGDLDSRLDAARSRLRTAIPPPSD